PGVGFAQLDELPLEATNARPGFAQVPFVLFPLGMEALGPLFPVVDELVQLIDNVGHLNLDGEHIRFGHCADVRHDSLLLFAGYWAGVQRAGGAVRRTDESDDSRGSRRCLELCILEGEPLRTSSVRLTHDSRGS